MFDKQANPWALQGLFVDRPLPGAPGLLQGYRYFATDVGPSGTEYVLAGSPLAWKTVGGDGAAPNLATVLVSGNDSGPTSILLQPAQRLDTDLAPAVPPNPANLLRLGTVNAAFIEIGKVTAPGVGNDDVKLFINQGGAKFISNAGVQYSSLFANRAQVRVNAFGNHDGVTGMTSFKSRALTIGAKASVLAGDSIFRVTAIGVTGNDSDVPISGQIEINVAPGGVPVGGNYIATEFAVHLVPLEGPINGHQEMFKVTSQGALCMRETAHLAPPGSVAVAAGVVRLAAAPFGTTFVPNVNITATTRVTLTVQDQVPAVPPLGSVFVLSRVIGVGFTIQSTAAAENTVDVYYQFWEPIDPAA